MRDKKWKILKIKLRKRLCGWLRHTLRVIHLIMLRSQSSFSEIQRSGHRQKASMDSYTVTAHKGNQPLSSGRDNSKNNDELYGS